MTPEQIAALPVDERKALARALLRKPPEGLRAKLVKDQRVIILPWNDEVARNFPHGAVGVVSSVGKKKVMVTGE